MNKQKIVRIDEIVNPHFKNAWTTKKQDVVLAGGRGSFKSSVISLRLVIDIINSNKNYKETGKVKHIVCFRKVQKNLLDSCFEQIKWAIEMLGLTDLFRFVPTRLKIIHKQSGAMFYFFGLDDYRKGKSVRIDANRLWFEEFDEYTDYNDILQTKASYTRVKFDDGDIVQTFYSFNPPKNPYHYIYDVVENMRKEPTTFYDHSTYLVDELGILSQQYINDINVIKQNDYDMYRQVFLGDKVSLGTLIYKYELLKVVKEMPKERIVAVYFGLDTGHSISATACVCCLLLQSGDVVIYDNYYYSPQGKANKLAPSQLSKNIHEFVNDMLQKEELVHARFVEKYIDSADGAMRNQMKLDYNEYWKPTKKGLKIDMIDNVQTLLAKSNVYVLDKESNNVFLEEHKRYEWNEKTLNSDNPQPIKENDHTCDAFQYIVQMNLKTFNLKF